MLWTSMIDGAENSKPSQMHHLIKCLLMVSGKPPAPFPPPPPPHTHTPQSIEMKHISIKSLDEIYTKLGLFMWIYGCDHNFFYYA